MTSLLPSWRKMSCQKRTLLGVSGGGALLITAQKQNFEMASRLGLIPL